MFTTQNYFTFFKNNSNNKMSAGSGFGPCHIEDSEEKISNDIRKLR